MSDYPQYPPASPPVPVVQNSTMSVVSLVAGIICWFALPIIGAVIAVVTGYMARSEIRSSGGRLSGEGFATAGIILGYIHLAVVVLGFCVIAIMMVLGITLPLLCIPFWNQPSSFIGVF